MAISNEKFDQFKIERLKNYLIDMAEKGQAYLFEIFVDALKVVPKTDNTKDFDSYERYMTEDTEKIRIVIYNSGLSNRNDQYVFYVHNKPKQETNGLGEIDLIVQKELAARDREHEMNLLRKELEETKKQLEEAEEYHASLEKQLEEERNGQHKRKIDVGEMASMILEGIVRRNPQWLNNVPVIGEGLAGMIAADNEKLQQKLNTPETEAGASFSKKTDITTANAEQGPYLQALQQLESVFNDEQLAVIWQVLGKFMEDPASLNAVAGLLNIKAPNP